MFRHRVSTRFVDKLENIVYSYNHTVHRAHEMKPSDVNQSNSVSAHNVLYAAEEETAPQCAVGTHVRIAKTNAQFEK